jgi:predicted ATP-dependent serine protease
MDSPECVTKSMLCLYMCDKICVSSTSKWLCVCKDCVSYTALHGAVTVTASTRDHPAVVFHRIPVPTEDAFCLACTLCVALLIAVFGRSRC